MTDMTKDATIALRKPFPKESVGKLPKPYKRDSPKGQCGECGGYHGLPAVHLDYVGHAATTDRLLTVDPEWSWEPMGVDQFGLPAPDAQGNLWIRLTVCGVTRIGVGDGASAKERIGDAIRNAAMRFGVALDLWAKEDLVEFAQAASRPTTEPPAGERAPDTTAEGVGSEREVGAASPAGSPLKAGTRGHLFALFTQKGIAEDQQLIGANTILGTDYTSRSQFTEEDAQRIIAVLKTKPDAAVPA